MRNALTAAFALALIAATPGASPRAQSLETAQAIPAELRVPLAPTAVRAEGRRHWLYELHVTNLGRTPLTLRRVEALDGRGTILATYAGEALDAVIARPGQGGDARTVVGPGLRAVIFVDVDQPDAAPAPAALTHRVTFAPVTPPNAAEQSVLSGGRIAPAAGRFAPLGPPLKGGGWLASHGLSNASSHRRTLLTLDGQAFISQRFAIDFTRIGEDGQAFRGDPADNRNWTPYGAEVLAVADGVVAETQDGVPENDPTADHKAVPITLRTVGGNFVILRLADGRHAFYAHLQPGSLRVRPGQRVRRGEVLARLGNSGQSDAPHLHLHITDRPGPLNAEGLPLVFERFELVGHIPSLKVLVDGTGWQASGPAEPRLGEMPVENAVIAFPR